MHNYGSSWGPDVRLAGGSTREAGLDRVERLSGHEGGVHGLSRPNPVIFRVPPHDGLVAGAYVFDVDEHFVSPLTCPYLIARIARVSQDRPERRLAPRQAVPMRVAVPVVATRRRDTFTGKPLGDGEAACSAQVLLEDPSYDWRGLRVCFEHV